MAEDETPNRALAKLRVQALAPARSLAERTLAFLWDRGDRAPANPDGRVAASSSPSEDDGAISTTQRQPVRTATTPFPIESSSRTSSARALLGPTLTGRDLEHWVPPGAGEAHRAIEEVADFCATYCPVRLACVEEKCRLFRLETRALEVLGIRRDPETDEVRVFGRPT